MDQIEPDASSWDVAIVGGGPAGLSAALMLGRSRRKVLVLDSQEPRNAAARTFHGYLGCDGKKPQELIEAARAEIARYGVRLRFATATSARCLPGERSSFAVTISSGQSITCRKLLMATGLRDRMPGVPGIKECYGISVHHRPYCDAWEHRDRRLVAYGATTSQALGLARQLTNWSSRVTVLLDGKPSPDEMNEHDRRRFCSCRAPVAELLHIDGHLLAVGFANGEQLPADALFFNFGQEPRSELARMVGCSVVEGDTPRTERKQRTNVPGLYVAGDVDGDVKFVIVAAAEGATAAVAINRELQEEDWQRLS